MHLLVTLYWLLSALIALTNFSLSFGSWNNDSNCGERLFLTPYIQSGRLLEARTAARVLIENINSYSGFLTINENTNSNLFFWFFPAEKNSLNAPLALWLEGGPGLPSMYTIFYQNGPFYITESSTLKKRRHYWSQEINVIYIDNPVGTGFSFTNQNGYVTNEVEVGRDLYAGLIQFFQLFPEYRNNDFYVTGESYAGKYVPATAITIHNNNPMASLKINLKGVAIGNGLVDPEHMMVYGEYLYQHGLIDKKTKREFRKMETRIVRNIRDGNYTEAFRLFNVLMNGDLMQYPSLFYNATGLTSLYNYATSSDTPYKPGLIPNWLSHCQNRRLIHCGNQTYDETSTVEEHLYEDVMQSVAPWLQIIMNNYRVLLYSGQLDIIVAYPLTLNYLNTLNWKGKNEYMIASRKLWYVDEQLAGYVKSAGNFTEILVRDAGHMVASDQPLWALDMISKFTRNEPFYNN